MQKEKENNEIGNKTNKYLPSKTKIDCITETEGDMDKKSGMPSMTSDTGVTNNMHLSYGKNNVKDSIKSNGTTVTPMHNHMNTNVFSNNDALKGVSLPKTQMLVQIDSTKQSGYSPSPLIFTTAKIHTDGKSKQMEPVHVTPVPILSTVEGNVIKTGTATNYGKGVNDQFRLETSDIRQNTQDINLINKNQTGSAPLSGLTNKTTSAAITKENSGNKIIITSSTLNQITQAPKTIDVKTTKVNIVPITSTTKKVHSALIKSEQSATTSLTQMLGTTKSTTTNKDPKSILEKTTPITSSTENKILTPITSGTSEFCKADSMTKVIEMDINENIQRPNSVLSPKPGTSSQVASSSKTITSPDTSGKDTSLTQRSNFLSNKNTKIQKQDYKIEESSFKPDGKQTAFKVNIDSDAASNRSNLKSDFSQSTIKSTSPNIIAVALPISSSASDPSNLSKVAEICTCKNNSHVQTSANLSKPTPVTKDSTVSVAKPVTTHDLIAATNRGMKITATNANSKIPYSDKTQSVAANSSVLSVVSKVSTVTTAKTSTANTTCLLKDTKVSEANTIFGSTPVVAVETTKIGASSNITSTTKTQAEVPAKSTSSESKPSTAKTSVVTTSQSLTPVNDCTNFVTRPINTKPHVTAAAPKITTTGACTNVTGTIKSQVVQSTKLIGSSSVSKPSTVSTGKTPAITSQPSTTAAQSSTKSAITNVKSTAAPRMSQTSTGKTVTGTSSSAASKPSTVTTMKSSAGQKVNISTTPKSVVPKSAVPVASTSTSIKKVFTEQSDKKASGPTKDAKNP